MPKNKLSDLQNHLFETLERLKDGDIDVETAKAVSSVAQTIVNTRKQHLEEVKTLAGLGGDFGDLAISQAGQLLNGQPANPPVEIPADSGGKIVSGSSQSGHTQTNTQSLSSLQKQIIDLIDQAGGETEIAKVTTTRQQTIDALKVLESRGILVCVRQPAKAEKGGAPGSSDGYSDCGVWKLAKPLERT